MQLQHGEEKAAKARRTGGAISERDARLVTTLSGAIFNFTRWSYRVEVPDAVIEVSEAERFPEVSMLAARGFLEYVVSRLRRVETQVDAARVAPTAWSSASARGVAARAGLRDWSSLGARAAKKRRGRL